MKIENFRNTRVTVMGLGSFGGGIGAARYLASHGACVTVTDMKTEAALEKSVHSLDSLDIRFVLGRHEKEDFTGADVVVVSPAVPRDSEYIDAARNAGVAVTTEIGLFVERCPANICGITGSNGKTTTVSMIQSILKQSGKRFHIGGNIGGSLLSDLSTIEHADHVILELSSFQLEWLEEMSWSPHIAALLNIMPNHLDRHGTFDEYRRIKATILDHQSPEDTAILMCDDAGSASMQDRVKGRLEWAGIQCVGDGITMQDGWIAERRGNMVKRIIESSRLLVPGRHNLLNALAATACARAMDVDVVSIAQGLVSFRGVPHRLEFVGERRGIQFYNDSKATTPEAAAAAIASFDRRVIPILGGYDKGVSFKEMALQSAGHIHWAALIGVTAPLISREFENAGIDSIIYSSLCKAFEACVAHASAGDVVVLTPGCASYDMFNNFEERGEAFRELVKEVAK